MLRHLRALKRKLSNSSSPFRIPEFATTLNPMENFGNFHIAIVFLRYIFRLVEQHVDEKQNLGGLTIRYKYIIAWNRHEISINHISAVQPFS
jgi:hypothetical protein